MLLDEVERGLGPETKPKSKADQEYNLLHWLLKSAPDCGLVKERLTKIEAANPELKPREHPDLDRVIGEVTETKEQSPVSAEELLAKSPDAQVDFLLSYNPQFSFDGPSRGEYCAPWELLRGSHSIGGWH